MEERGAPEQEVHRDLAAPAGEDAVDEGGGAATVLAVGTEREPEAVERRRVLEGEDVADRALGALVLEPCRGHDRAGAVADDRADRDARLFEDAQHAEVRESARAAATEDEGDATMNGVFHAAGRDAGHAGV